MYLTHNLVSLLWIILLCLLIFRAWFFKSFVSGLGICHWFSQAINHFFAEFFINFSGEVTDNRSNAEIGYEISGLGILGLIFSFLVVNFVYVYNHKVCESLSYVNVKRNINIGYYGLGFGLIAYFMLTGLLAFVSSITSIVSAGLALASGSIAWLYILAFRTGVRNSLAYASLGFFLPLMTLILSGFIGYGISAIFTVGAIVFVTYKPRFVIFLLLPIMLFFGLSLYPSYMISRNEIRDSVWGGDNIEKRFEITANSINENWQWFDPTNPQQMELLNGRLNQNVLVGAAYNYIEDGNCEFAFGETLVDGVLALIPRAIWQNKPLSAGSNGLVTKYTGIRFGQGTSVGIGNLMEFYVNSGLPLVFFGYFTIGCFVYWMDIRTGQAISQLDPYQFLLWFVPAQSLMNSIGSFVEWGPSFIGAFLLVSLFLFFHKRFAD